MGHREAADVVREEGRRAMWPWADLGYLEPLGLLSQLGCRCLLLQGILNGQKAALLTPSFFLSLGILLASTTKAGPGTGGKKLHPCPVNLNA